MVGLQRRCRWLAVAAVAAVSTWGWAGCDEPTPHRLIGAGDISKCTDAGDSATADVVAGLEGTVVTFGDNVYERGTSAEYEACYRPTWGRFDGRVRPSPGNHEHGTPEAAGYYGYFGERAGPPGVGAYFYDVGAWRVFSLDSEVGVAAGADFVRAHADGRACIAAYWHKPLVSSGAHGNNPSSLPLWQAIYDVGGDLVLNGHDHVYERFGELGRTGAPEPGGMRELVVGTGGAPLYDFAEVKPGSEVRSIAAQGVISVDLGDDGYAWRFHPVAGQSFTDAGSGDCTSGVGPTTTTTTIEPTTTTDPVPTTTTEPTTTTDPVSTTTEPTTTTTTELAG